MEKNNKKEFSKKRVEEVMQIVEYYLAIGTEVKDLYAACSLQQQDKQDWCYELFELAFIAVRKKGRLY